MIRSTGRGKGTGKGKSKAGAGASGATDWLPFEVAREIVRKLDLRSKKEWEEWCKAPGQRPPNIPTTPNTVYRDAGWISIPDWLGYGQGRGARQPQPSSSSSSRTSSTSTQRVKKEKKKDVKIKKPAANAPSRKRARAPDADADLDVSSGPEQTKIKVEEIGGFSIVSSAYDLKHTACGLLSQGPPTS